MKSTTDQSWPALAGAIVDSRNALRGKVIPSLDRLERMLVDREALAILQDVRGVALATCNALRFALKRPGQRRP